MAENKTLPTKVNPSAFLKKIGDKALRDDCLALMDLMGKVSKCEPVMWGSAIVGFGSYHYVYDSGREGDTMIIGFSPRKANISIYFMGGKASVAEELAELGKHGTGGGCVHIKSLADVDIGVLKKVFAKACKEAKSRAKLKA